MRAHCIGLPEPDFKHPLSESSGLDGPASLMWLLSDASRAQGDRRKLLDDDDDDDNDVRDCLKPCIHSVELMEA